jgi:hypothetical protein
LLTTSLFRVKVQTQQSNIEVVILKYGLNLITRPTESKTWVLGTESFSK